MGPGPIPWTAVNEYAQRYGLDDDEQEDFEYLIGEMDDTYLKYAADRAEKDKPVAPRTPLKSKLGRR